MKNIAIIGSGFGGLSAACYLAKAGYKVSVYEKNEQLGGRASVKKAEGFTRDMGPSRYLMPDLFEQFFADFDKEVSDYLTLSRLDPSYKIYFKDNPKHPEVSIAAKLEDNFEQFESFESGASTVIQDYLAKSELQYHIGINEFAIKNYDSVFDFFNKRMLLDAMKLNIFSSIGAYVKKFFSSDEMQKIIQYPMLFLGSPLYETPALYNLMSYVDFGMGVWYPQGGIGSVIQALVDLGTELGVTYHTNHEVTAINTTPAPKKHWWHKQKTKITGLTFASGKTISTDYIVSNADMHWTETQLLQSQDQTHPESYRDKHVLAPSGFCIYLGLDTKIDGLEHHTLIFNQDRETNNNEIFKTRTFPSDPSYYICCPSKTDASVAPAGSENLFILVPFPSRVTMGAGEKQAYRDKIITAAQDLLGQELESHIVHEEIFGPDEFTSRYHAYGGNALSGGAHLFKQTAFYRPNNVSKKVQGLYYAGGYTNPGIGMPTCMISGKLASMRVAEGEGK